MPFQKGYIRSEFGKQYTFSSLTRINLRVLFNGEQYQTHHYKLVRLTSLRGFNDK